MDFDLDMGWQIQPAGGETGAAFIGVKASEKIFLKRNSSPFLAALSAEGITPRLIWTKRMTSGDVVIAQEWLNGKTLARQEMDSKEVAQLIGRVHHSKALKNMLGKVGGHIYSAQQLLQDYFYDLPNDLRQHPLLKTVADELKAQVNQIKSDELAVCHGDLNHKNWLLSDRNRLYLVDWDSAMISDPAVDLGMVLAVYVKREHWHRWLRDYGVALTDDLLMRVQWYGYLQLLKDIKHHCLRGRFTQMNREILRLQTLRKNEF